MGNARCYLMVRMLTPLRVNSTPVNWCRAGCSRSTSNPRINAEQRRLRDRESEALSFGDSPGYPTATRLKTCCRTWSSIPEVKSQLRMHVDERLPAGTVPKVQFEERAFIDPESPGRLPPG